MNKLRKRIEGGLHTVGLYDPARRLWSGKPDLRALCQNAGYRLVGTPDRLPIPPTRLIYLVADSNEVSWFLTGGKMEQQSIIHVLQRNGLCMEDFEAVLDFGCGCGRVMRHWKSLSGPRLYGTDYNAKLIRWCQRKLDGLAQFRVNQLTPPLDYPDEAFDFIYAISVFTHWTEDLQFAWIDELRRVLKYGGLLLLTVHGESHLYDLDPEERQRFQSGDLVIKQEGMPGSNRCGAYHPEQYVRDTLARGYEVVDFVARGARDADQDIFLLRKPASGPKRS